MAKIKRTKAGYYEKTITIGHKLNEAGVNIPVRKRFYAKTLKELDAKIDEYKAVKRSGIENNKQYFGILADSWINEFFINDGSLKDSTKIRYYTAWQRVIKPLPLYHTRIDEISAKTIQAAYNKLVADGVPASEIKQAHKLLRKFYKYVDAECIGRDITGALMIPKEHKNKAEKNITVWTDEELKTIFNSFHKADNRFRYRFLIVLAYYTGCRKSELLALKYDDITASGVRITKTLAECTNGIKNGTIETHLSVTDPKTAASVRTVPVDPAVLDELKRHKAKHLKEQLRNNYRSDYIFTTASGGFIDPKDLDRALSRYYKSIGIKSKSMHTYRHTYGSNLCANGTPIQTVCKLMGHSDISITAKYYVNVSESEKQAAALTLKKAII